MQKTEKAVTELANFIERVFSIALYRSLYFFSIPLLFKVKSMARQMNSHHLPFYYA